MRNFLRIAKFQWINLDKVEGLVLEFSIQQDRSNDYLNYGTLDLVFKFYTSNQDPIFVPVPIISFNKIRKDLDNEIISHYTDVVLDRLIESKKLQEYTNLAGTEHLLEFVKNTLLKETKEDPNIYLTNIWSKAYETNRQFKLEIDKICQDYKSLLMETVSEIERETNEVRDILKYLDNLDLEVLNAKRTKLEKLNFSTEAEAKYIGKRIIENYKNSPLKNILFPSHQETDYENM